MKIALCLTSLPLSGIGTSIGIVRSGLSNAGHEVDVVITSGEPGGDFERARRDGWSVECCCKGVRFLKERLKRTLDCLSGYDLVINNHSAETQLVAPCISGDMMRVSVLRGTNDSAVEMVSLNSQYFDAAVAISLEMQGVMERTPDIQCPVHLIPNCTDAAADELNGLDLPIKIAYVGRIGSKDKNVMVLPDVASKLAARNVDFALTIAGDGPDYHRLQSRIDRVAVADKITMLGEVSRGKARDVLRRSHFTLMPSSYEGLSNVMLEAMALGSVPVASDIANFKWVLGDAAARLQVPVSCAESYAGRIAELAADTAEYHRIQGYLHRRQRDMFTPEKTVSGYLNLIGELKTRRLNRKFESASFSRLSLPRRYERQCTAWWRCLQIARDCLHI
ncbi:MAG: glycosyltransferase family 4 protein [Planctomycetota bacterium]